MSSSSLSVSLAPRQRLPLVDAFKAVASQCIVLHHLAFYGPLSDGTYLLAPDLVAWFSQDARMAVQVFLVIAGFLAARSLAPQAVLITSNPLAQLWQRYVRVALPYIAALLVAIACTKLASHWMQHDSLPDPPTFWQFVSHVLLLQSVLDMDSLSAGVWYVAIDFQLFALLLTLLWVASRWPVAASNWRRRLSRALVWAVGLASLFYFNCDADWDVWGLYFFGAYGLGALAYWFSQLPSSAARRSRMWGLVALTLLALALDFRMRIALALAVALVLALSLRKGWLYTWPRSPVLAYLGKISYSVFLLNFPVALVVNAWFTHYGVQDEWLQTAGVLVAWLACNLAGAAFYHLVEQKLSRLGRSKTAKPGLPKDLGLGHVTP